MAVVLAGPFMAQVPAESGCLPAQRPDRRHCYSATSLDAFRPPGGERDGLTIHDTMGVLDRHLADFVDRKALRPLLLALPDRERTILAVRFFEQKTQSQIAEQLGMSQMHVPRLLAGILAQLRCELLTP